MAAGSGDEIVRFVIPITSGASNIVRLWGKTILDLQFPASFTAGDVIVECSHEGTTFAPAYEDDGTAITIAGDASRYVFLEERLFQGRRYVRLKCDGQAAARTITARVVSNASLIHPNF